MKTIDISAQMLNFSCIMPSAIVVIFAILLLMATIFARNLAPKFYAIFCLIAISLSLAVLIGTKIPQNGFFGMIIIDGYSFVAQIIILLGSFLFIALSIEKYSSFEYKFSEYFALFLFSVAGFLLMVSSKNLILIFISLEFSSLCIYTMIGLNSRLKSISSAIKYFTMGALSSAFFALSITLLFMFSNSFMIDEILSLKNFAQISALFLGGAIILLCALGFKLSLVPFHGWIGDVYEGSSALLAGYIATVPKMAVLVVMLRFFAPLSDIEEIKISLYLIAILTMSFGNLMAYAQKDVKKLLAFSSISHSGFVICAILTNFGSNLALFLYWIMFLFANLGAFAILSMLRGSLKSYKLDSFKAMSINSPIFAILFALFLLTLAGIPPFGVFWGKMILFEAVISQNFIKLAVIMALNSALALYYYLRIIVYMFFKDDKATKFSLNLTAQSVCVLILAAFASILAVFYINWLFNFILKNIS